MTKDEAAVVAKIVTGPWDKEYTPELAIAFSIALEQYEYKDAVAAVSVLLKQADRRFAPNPGEIVGQIKTKLNTNNPARHYFKATEIPESERPTLEQRQAQIAEMRGKYPDLYTATTSSKVQRKGFDEGCSD